MADTNEEEYRGDDDGVREEVSSGQSELFELASNRAPRMTPVTVSCRNHQQKQDRGRDRTAEHSEIWSFQDSYVLP